MTRERLTEDCAMRSSSMGGDCALELRNRQKVRAVDLRLFREILSTLLKELMVVQKFELGVCLVESKKMTELNETFLREAGSTDVITFDYSSEADARVIHGDI